MFDKEYSTRQLWLAGTVVLCLLGVVALQSWAFIDLRHDDAFITYRYGQNLAAGYGLVFNPGERVMASTSPGQALLSALTILLVGEEQLPAIMIIVGCLCWTGQALILVVLLRKALGLLGAGLVGLAVLFGAAGSFNYLALETNAAAMLALLTLLATVANRWRLGAIAAGLAIFVRPDTGLVALLFLGICLYRQRRAAFVPLGILAGLIGSWAAFAWWYFGTPLPRSALVKFHDTTPLEYLAHLVRHPVATLARRGDLLTLCATWALVFVGAALLVRRDRRLWTFVAYGALHFVAYLFLRPTTLHTWHLYPLVLVTTVLVLGALAGILHRSGWLFIAASCVTLGGLALVFALRASDTARRNPVGYWSGARHQVYEQLGRYLRTHARPSDLFAALEVGTIAYYSHLPAYDVSGLVTPLQSELPSDTRYMIFVRHQFPGWWDPNWPAPTNPLFHGQPAILRFEASRFVAWLYVVPPDLPP